MCVPRPVALWFLSFAIGSLLARQAIAQSAGVLDLSFDTGPGANATVQTVVAAPEGAVFAAGNFTVFNDTPRSGVVRLNSDGSLDPAFAPAFTLPADGGVFVVTPLPDGKVLVGGRFSDLNGSGRRTLVRLLANGTIDPSFQAGFPDLSGVLAIAVDDTGGIYAGGAFAMVDGVRRASLVRLRANGALDPAFTPPPIVGIGSPVVTAIVVQRDAKVLVGGQFQASEGVERWDNLMRLRDTGEIDSDFRSQAAVNGAQAIAALALEGTGHLLVAGTFPFSGQQSGQALRRLRPDGTRDEGFRPEFRTSTNSPATLNTLLIDAAGRTVVGGDFATVNGEPQPWMARVLADGSRDPRFSPAQSPDGEVTTLDRDSLGRILLGGDFRKIGAASPGRIARLLNPPLPPLILQQPQATTTSRGGNVALRVRAEADTTNIYKWYRNGTLIPGETGAELYLVNATATDSYLVQVSNLGGVLQSTAVTVTVLPRTAGALDASFLPAPVTENAPAFSNVYSVRALRPDGRLLVEVGGFREHTVLQLQPDGSRDPGFRITLPNPTGSTHLLDAITLLPDGRLLLHFPSSEAPLARYTVEGIRDPAFSLRGLAPSSTARSMLVAPLGDGRLLIAGRLMVGPAEYALVRVTPNGDYDPSYPGLRTSALGGFPVSWLQLLDDGKVMIGGVFNRVNGASNPGLARLTPSGEVDASYTPMGMYIDRGTTAAGNSELYAGASGFEGVARFRPDGTRDPTFLAQPRKLQQGGNRSFELPAPASVSISSDGSLWLQGDFDRYAGATVRPPIRVQRDGRLDTSFNITTWPTANGTEVRNITLVGESVGRLFFSGEFDAVAGQPRPGLAAIFRTAEGEARLVNLSTRTWAGRGEELLIVGFGVEGSGQQPLLVRAVGPTLAAFGVAGVLEEPRLEVFRGASSLFRVGSWLDRDDVAAAATRTGAFALPVGSMDAAFLGDFGAGGYSVQVSGPAEGVALAEIYLDQGNPNTQLTNLSTRAVVASGDRALIVGFTIRGSREDQVLVRGVGPTLAGLGVAGALADPTIRVVQNGVTVATNDNWASGVDPGFVAAATRQSGGFELPTGSRDAALLLKLGPGSYTVVVESNVPGARGIVLAELYYITR